MVLITLKVQIPKDIQRAKFLFLLPHKQESDVSVFSADAPITNFPEPKVMSLNILFCLKPKDTQFQSHKTKKTRKYYHLKS